MERKNNFISKNESENFFLEFPKEQVYTMKFIPKHIQGNPSIKLSKYTIIEDNEVFLYE